MMRWLRVWAPIAMVALAYGSAASTFMLEVHWTLGAFVFVAGIAQSIWFVREGRRIDRSHVRRMIELKFTGNIEWMDRPEDRP